MKLGIKAEEEGEGEGEGEWVCKWDHGWKEVNLHGWVDVTKIVLVLVD